MPILKDLNIISKYELCNEKYMLLMFTYWGDSDTKWAVQTTKVRRCLEPRGLNFGLKEQRKYAI